MAAAFNENQSSRHIPYLSLCYNSKTICERDRQDLCDFVNTVFRARQKLMNESLSSLPADSRCQTLCRPVFIRYHINRRQNDLYGGGALLTYLYLMPRGETQSNSPIKFSAYWLLHYTANIPKNEHVTDWWDSSSQTFYGPHVPHRSLTELRHAWTWCELFMHASSPRTQTSSPRQTKCLSVVGWEGGKPTFRSQSQHWTRRVPHRYWPQELLLVDAFCRAML